jgi:hypothetical protein
VPRPEILALSEGLYGHPAPSREAGEEVAGSIGAGANRTGGDRFGHGDLDTHGAYPLLEVGGRTNSDGYRDGDGIGAPGDPMYSLQARHQHGVAHTLRAEGFDASEDGTGRDGGRQ